jgi:hypothetical protein
VHVDLVVPERESEGTHLALPPFLFVNHCETERPVKDDQFLSARRWYCDVIE